MKKFLAIMLALVMVLGLAACTPKSGNDTDDQATDIAGEYAITVWVPQAAVELTQKQIDEFNESNEFGVKFNATIQEVSEADAATNMITDVEAGGDIFFFAQDQFARLVKAAALSKLGAAAAETVKAANDDSVVAAGTAGEDLYAYPLTSDNGYFMYYDKSVIPEADLDSLEKLIADCEEQGKYFAFELQTSAWYLASFFFGAGCKSVWTTDNDGNFSSVDDDFNSDKGLIAAKGIEKLVKSPCHVSSSQASEFANGAAIVVTGTWDYENVKNALGDNMGATDLPSFEVDGQQYHLGSFNGCKLLGVKPQTDAKKGAALHKLAQFLTDEKHQMERFETLAWGPANKVDQASEAVQANPALAALLAQNAYSVPQGQIPDPWWDVAKVIGDEIKNATDEAGLKAALENYETKLNGIFTTLASTDYVFVGAWCDWNNTDENYIMTVNGDELSITLDVPESDYMGGRIVKKGSWDTDLGYAQVTTGADLMKVVDAADNGDNNIIFAAAGNYTVVCNTATGEITITAN